MSTIRRSHDVIVAGGSVAGLSFASEAARRGLDVVVFEEDEAIGEPEKCDGLVSLRDLRRYMAPEAACIQTRVTKGVIHSPSGRSLSLDASRLDVAVLDRSEYDKQLAGRAEAWGARVATASRVEGVRETGESVKVSAGGSVYESRLYVDATGPSGVMPRNRRDLVPAAKYEVKGDWFRDGEVEVYLNQLLYPGFFAWVIPRGGGLAKVGVAGRGINSFGALDSFLGGRGATVVKRVAAPIFVGGSVERFVSGRTMYVGESAGQVKPTTAGGITTSAAAGVIAARWAADSLTLRDPSLLEKYQPDWESRFLKEFRVMKRLRRIFECLSNEDVERVAAQLSSPRVRRRISSSDFDFHASGLLSALGMTGILKLASVIISAEAKQALTSLV